MAVTEGKKKKLPTFPYLHKSRAKRLRKSWIEDHKIRSKWKAQKRKEGLTNQTSALLEDVPTHSCDEVKTNLKAGATPIHAEIPPQSTSPQHRQSLRDLRRLAYVSKSRPTPKADSLLSKKATMGRESGQPNMKLRMNLLLEKIKRDFS